jgi:hypothetical protein
MLELNGAWLCGLSSVPQGSGLSRLRSSHSISHRADEIDNPHLCTCAPSHESFSPVPLPVVLTHVLAPLGPVLLLLEVLTHVLPPLAPLLQ